MFGRRVSPIKKTVLHPVGRGMVPNPPNPSVSILEPHKEGGSRTSVVTTDWELHVGSEPAHIDRIKQANMFGYVGPRGINSFAAMDANMRPLGHVPLLHRVTGVPPDYGITVDDRAYIPAVMAGNPLE